MRYISLFSGIRSFEKAIGDRGECVAYAEIDKNAISEYSRHYPNHLNLGNVLNITKKDIDKLGRIDLLVVGFPCNNLSSANRHSRHGLDGEHSGLFWNMIDIIKWIRRKNPKLRIIIENNASMSGKWRNEITQQLSIAMGGKKVFCNFIDSSCFVPQQRKRYYWTVGIRVPHPEKVVYDLGSLLETSYAECRKHAIGYSVLKYKNVCPERYTGSSGIFVKRVGALCCEIEGIELPSRWKSKDNYSYNNTVHCITTTRSDNVLFDYRLCRGAKKFIPRFYTKNEMCRLFGYPDDYVATEKKTVYQKLFGMSVVVPVVGYVFEMVLKDFHDGRF